MDDAIRRIDREPDDKLVAKSIIDGSFGRQEELRSFLDVLCRIEGNYSIFLDGEWGVGKTFFVNQAIAALRSFSSKAFLEEYGIDKAMAAQISEAVRPDSWSDSNIQVPAYFNAWKYDFADNPTVPLLDSLIESFPDQSDSLKAARGTRDAVISILRGFSLNVCCGPASVGYSFSDLTDNQRMLTDSISLQKQVRERIGELLEKCLEGRGNRVVLFIDELDRCRPDYAAKVLEATKFLFDQSSLTIVFSVNTQALSSVLSSKFGEGFSGPRYLMRFYDRKIHLHTFDSIDYLASIAGVDGLLNSDLINVTSELAKSRDLNMRDLNRCVSYLVGAYRSLEKHDMTSRYYKRETSYPLHSLTVALPIDLALYFGSMGITPDEFFRSDDLIQDYAVSAPRNSLLRHFVVDIRISHLFSNVHGEPMSQSTQPGKEIDTSSARINTLIGFIKFNSASYSLNLTPSEQSDFKTFQKVVLFSFFC